MQHVDVSTLYWLFFYIAVGILGIFLTLVYLAFRPPRTKKPHHK
ncbi:MAG: hypothetical protein ACR2LN_02905 [Candidatus Levyibacteriota bacterium]